MRSPSVGVKIAETLQQNMVPFCIVEDDQIFCVRNIARFLSITF